MTTLTQLAQEVKEYCAEATEVCFYYSHPEDASGGAFSCSPDRISALMDVVLRLAKTVEYYSGNEDGETSWQKPDNFVPYWTLWDSGDCVGAEKAMEALAYAEERLKSL
jgi:hypothetical protein